MQLWKEEPSYYGGDILHQAKKEKIQKAMEENGLDAILLLKAETVATPPIFTSRATALLRAGISGRDPQGSGYDRWSYLRQR